MFSDDINEALFDFVVVSVETPFPSKTNGKNLQNKFKKKFKKKQEKRIWKLKEVKLPVYDVGVEELDICFSLHIN